MELPDCSRWISGYSGFSGRRLSVCRPDHGQGNEYLEKCHSVLRCAVPLRSGHGETVQKMEAGNVLRTIPEHYGGSVSSGYLCIDASAVLLSAEGA